MKEGVGSSFSELASEASPWKDTQVMVIRRLTRQPRPQSEAKPAWGSGVYALSPVGSSSTSLYSMSVLGLLWRCFWCGPWPGSLSAVEAAASAKGSAGSVCSRYGDCALEGADSNAQLLQLDLAMPSGGSDIASFLWLTDAHVDPYYTSSDRQCIKKQTPQLGHYPFGVIGCDPPPALLHSILEGAAGWLRDHADTSSYCSLAISSDMACRGCRAPGRMQPTS